LASGVVHRAQWREGRPLPGGELAHLPRPEDGPEVARGARARAAPAAGALDDLEAILASSRGAAAARGATAAPVRSSAGTTLVAITNSLSHVTPAHVPVPVPPRPARSALSLARCGGVRARIG